MVCKIIRINKFINDTKLRFEIKISEYHVLICRRWHYTSTVQPGRLSYDNLHRLVHAWDFLYICIFNKIASSVLYIMMCIHVSIFCRFNVERLVLNIKKFGIVGQYNIQVMIKSKGEINQLYLYIHVWVCQRNILQKHCKLKNTTSETF